MKRLLIVKAGEAIPEVRAARGDYDAWIAAGMGFAVDEVDVVDCAAGRSLPDPATPAGVVVTGSSAMVSERADWSERAGAWLVRAVAAGTPILGICYGHQLLAQALGGAVGKNPRGREIGTVTVRNLPPARDDALLGALGDASPVHATHVESVLALPAGAVRLAESDLDPMQAIRFAERVWGVQFHPEFDAEVTRAYLAARRERVVAEGLDADALRAGIRDTPAAAQVLRRFADLLDA